MCRPGACAGAGGKTEISPRSSHQDAQAAMRRIVADEPGPGQKYAVLARKWVAAL